MRAAPRLPQDVPSGVCELPWPGSCNRPCYKPRLRSAGSPEPSLQGWFRVKLNKLGAFFLTSPVNGSCDAGESVESRAGGQQGC